MKPTSFSALLAALPLCALAAPQGLDMNKVSETHIEMADVSRAGVAGKSFAAATIIDAPLPKICAVIQDFAAYPRFMPNTESARVAQTAATYSLVDMTLKLPMGKIKKYRLKMIPASTPKSCQLSWKLVPWDGLKPEETIVDTSGAWTLLPAPSQPDKTLVQYAVYTDPGAIPLGLGWIVDSLSKDSIPKMLEALRGQVK